jgi:hypothetical protein
VVGNGKEPEFTNHARIKGQDTFTETLDYLFLSPGWSVKGVMPCATRKDVEGKGPYPNAEEPSDHIMIGSTFQPVSILKFLTHFKPSKPSNAYDSSPRLNSTDLTDPTDPTVYILYPFLFFLPASSTDHTKLFNLSNLSTLLTLRSQESLNTQLMMIPLLALLALIIILTLITLQVPNWGRKRVWTSKRIK